MKNILFSLVLIVIATLFGCSKSDSSSSSVLNPPSWIQGSWTTTGDNGWYFSSTDVAMIIPGNTSLGFAQIATLEGTSDQIQELTNTDTVYSFKAPAECTVSSVTTSGSTTYIFTQETNSIVLTGSTDLSCTSVIETTYQKN